MKKDTDALLERVHKLLRLAESPNVHEAAAAAARAQALIEEHRLEGLLDSDADDEDISDGREAPLEAGKRLRRWKTVLAHGLAEANGCKAYTLRAGGETHLLLIGRVSDREAVLAMWPWLVKRIEWCCATHGAGRGRSWQKAFKVGAAEVVSQRLAEAQREARAGLDSTALARVEPALQRRRAAVEAFAEARMDLKRGRRLRVHAEGYLEGRHRGASLPLERGRLDD